MFTLFYRTINITSLLVISLHAVKCIPATYLYETIFQNKTQIDRPISTIIYFETNAGELNISFETIYRS